MCDLSEIHPLSECKWPALNRSDSQLVSRSLRHHLWSCLRRSGSGVSLITSSSVIMSLPVWKCFSLITSSSVIMSSPVWKWCRAHYVIICDHVFAGLEVVSRSLRHHLGSCLRRSGSVSRSLRHHLWSCLRRSGSGVSLITSSSVNMSSPVWKCFSLITSSSVNMSSPVWKWCLAHYVIICDHVFAGLEVFLAHYVIIICDHVFAGLEVFLAHYVIICDHVFAGLEVFLAHDVIICDHVFAGLEVVSCSLRHHLWSCLRRSGSVFSLITSSSVIMSSPVWKWCLAHYVIICEHVFAGLEVVSRSLRHHLWTCLRRSGSVSRSLRHHLWTCLRRSGSGVALITSSSVIMSSPVWKWCPRSLRHHLWSCLRRSGSGVSLITSSSVIMSSPVWSGVSLITSSSVIMSSPVWKCFSLITSSSVNMSSPVWKWCRAHYVIICDHVFAGLEVGVALITSSSVIMSSPVLEVVSRSLRHHLWSCLRRSGSGVALITSSSVIMSSPVWKWCLAHYVIICDHVFAGLEVVSRSLRHHHLWSCLRRSGSVSRSLRHHLWSCLRRSGSGVALITSSSVIMSSPVWKWCLAHYVIICEHVFAGLEVVSCSLRHHLWSCLRRSGSVSRSLRHHLWSCLRRSGSVLAHYVIICDHVFAGLEVVSRSLRHHLWSCLRRSGSVSPLITSSSVIMSSPVWKCFSLITSSSVIMSSRSGSGCLAHYVIICDHVFAGLEVVSRSLRHHLWSCLRRSGSGVVLITSSSVIMSSPVWKWCRAHYVIICDHVFAGLEVVSRSLRHHLWSCLRRSGSGVSLITSSSVIMSSPVWKWCLAHYVIICDHVFAGLEVVSRSLRHHLWSCLRRSGSCVSLITSSSVIMSFAGLEVVSRSLRHHLVNMSFAGLEVVSRSLRHHLWTCLRRSGSGVALITSSSVIMSSPVWKCFSLITSSSVIMSSPVWKCFSLITSSSVIMSSSVWKWCRAHYRHHLWSCLRRSGSGVSLITSSSVIMSSPVWKWCLAHYVIIWDHVFAGLEVVSRSLRHHLWSCLRRSGSGVSLITSSSVIMSSPVWKCFSLITSSSVIMVFAGLEVVSRSLRHHLWSCLRRSEVFLAHYVIICEHVFAGLEVVSRSLRHHLWSCLCRSGSGVVLITSSSVIMSSPVWKWCLAHYVIICDHVFAGLEVVSRSLRHHLWSCLRRSGSVSRSLRHHLWTCLRRSGSGVALITSSSVIMSLPVWKWCRAHYVIICDHVFAGLEVVSRSLRHHLWSCLHRSGSGCLAHYVIIICDHVFAGLEVFLAHYVIICDHVFTGLEVVSRSLRHHLWSCLRRSGSVSRWQRRTMLLLFATHVQQGLREEEKSVTF